MFPGCLHFLEELAGKFYVEFLTKHTRMVCCFLPCIKWCRRKLKLDPTPGPCTLLVTEILRWVVIVIPLYLSVWRYTVFKGYTVFVDSSDVRGQFWGIMTAILVGVTLVVYLPIKLCGMGWRLRQNKVKGLRWRPSVVTYNIFCALPCYTLILYGAKTKEIQDPNETMDSVTVVSLQVMVLGLTFTEWMSKMREEEVTYDLLTAMADDFFFAYDVIEFITMSTRESHIYHSSWVYVCFVFAFVSMFKYVPAQPTSITGSPGVKRGASAHILAGMLCCDVPFVVIRVSTLAIYGFDVSDLIHPVKNVAMIIFDATQLYIIHKSVRDTMRQKPKPHISKKRIPRNPECWEEHEASELGCQGHGNKGMSIEEPIALIDVESVEAQNGSINNESKTNNDDSNTEKPQKQITRRSKNGKNKIDV